ncbi:membrane protein [Escherichia coli]|nr:membrane protein [Escherichia coli]
MKKKLISGLFLMLWMALLIEAMVYPQGIFPVLSASGVWGSLFADMGGNSGSTGCVN